MFQKFLCLSFVVLLLLGSILAEDEDKSDVDISRSSSKEKKRGDSKEEKFHDNKRQDDNPTSFVSAPLLQAIIKLNIVPLTKSLVFWAALPDCSSEHTKELQALYFRAAAGGDKCHFDVLKDILSHANITLVDGAQMYHGLMNMTTTKSSQVLQLSKMVSSEEKTFQDLVGHLDKMVEDAVALKKSPKCVTDEAKDIWRKLLKEYDAIAKCVDHSVEEAIRKGKGGLRSKLDNK